MSCRSKLEIHVISPRSGSEHRAECDCDLTSDSFRLLAIWIESTRRAFSRAQRGVLATSSLGLSATHWPQAASGRMKQPKHAISGSVLASRLASVVVVITTRVPPHGRLSAHLALGLWSWGRQPACLGSFGGLGCVSGLGEGPTHVVAGSPATAGSAASQGKVRDFGSPKGGSESDYYRVGASGMAKYSCIYL